MTINNILDVLKGLNVVDKLKIIFMNIEGIKWIDYGLLVKSIFDDFIKVVRL